MEPELKKKLDLIVSFSPQRQPRSKQGIPLALRLYQEE
jgi:hypothetical protein